MYPHGVVPASYATFSESLKYCGSLGKENSCPTYISQDNNLNSFFGMKDSTYDIAVLTDAPWISNKVW